MKVLHIKFSRRSTLLASGLALAVVLSIGTVSAAYSKTGQVKPVSKAMPQQFTLLDQGKKVSATPAELGWSDGKVNKAALTKKITAIAATTEQAPVDAKIVTQNGQYVVSPSTPGSKVDVAKAVRMINSGLFARSATIPLPVITVAPAVTEASLQPQLQQMKAQQAATAAKAAQLATASAHSCADNLAGRQLVLVSISQQHLWACSGATQVYDTPITSGAYLAGDATPTGTWHIYAKETNQVLKGCDANGCWSDPVNYWMPFYSDYGFHDASWQTFAYGSSQYASDGSHGCVHLPAAAMTWLYGWAAVGTTVTING